MRIERTLSALNAEPQKVGGFFIIIILFALFTANLLSGLWTGERASLPDQEIMRVATEAYLDDPDAFWVDYTAWESRYEDWFALAFEAARSGDSAFSLPSPTQNHGEYVFDETVYRRTLVAAGRRDEVLRTLDRLIAEAEQNAADSSTARLAYNARVIALYAGLRDKVYIGFEDARGWDLLLCSPWQGVTALLVLILFTGRLFTVEYESGMAALIYSSRYGRRQALLSKIGISCFAALLVLVVSFTGAAVGIELTTGFSSHTNGIQVFPFFTYCPAAWSVAGTLLRVFFMKWGVLCLFAFVTALLSVHMKNLLASAAAVSGVVLICFVGVLLTQRGGRLPYAVNPMTALATADGMTRFYAVFLFGCECSLSLLYLVAWLLFSGVLLFLTLLRTDVAQRSVKLSKKTRSTKKLSASSAMTMRKRSSSLLVYELLKQISLKKIVLVLLLLLIQSMFTQAVFGGRHDIQDRLYEEYMTVLAGEISPEKTAYLKTEREHFDEILASREGMEQAYADGEIITEEFSAYIEEYEAAYSHSAALDRVIQRDEDLNEVSENHASPAWFVYESGYENLILSGGDLLLLLAIFYLASDVFPIEYKGNSSFSPEALLIRSAKLGRKTTGIAKAAACVTVTAVLYLLSTSVRFCIIARNWSLPTLDAPAYSLERFAEVGSISIAHLFCLIALGRLIVLLLLAGIILFLTHRIRDGTPVFVIFAALILIPSICERLGVMVSAYLNLSAGYNLFLM